jgi:hypothetical protein
MVASLLLTSIRPASARATRIRFEDATGGAGLSTEIVPSWGSAWSDYDRDDDPDLFVGAHTKPPSLYRNNDGRFARLRVSELFSPRRMDRHGCAWGEANGDGRPDIYCTQGANRGFGRGPNQLFIQTDTGFENRAAAFGVRDPLGRGRTVNWLDHDTDGDLDIFVGNHIRRGHPNVLFENLGSGFRRAKVGLSRELRTLSSSWADWDRDGDPDLFMTQRRGVREHTPIALENRAGRYFRVELGPATSESWDSAAWGDFDGDGWIDLHLVDNGESAVLRNRSGRLYAYDKRQLTHGRASTWFDLDNDGDLDLFVVQGAPEVGFNRPDILLLNRGDRFIRFKREPFDGPRRGGGEAVSATDYDSDGRVDLFVTNGFRRRDGRNVLLHNLTTGGNWAALRLAGDDRNPDGLGAQIVVSAGDQSYVRSVGDGVAGRAQSDTGTVHLGLASNAEADIRVEWPDDVADCRTVTASSVVVVAKGSSPCESVNQPPGRRARTVSARRFR